MIAVGAALVFGVILGWGGGRWWEVTTRAWIMARETRRAVRPRYREAWATTWRGVGTVFLILLGLALAGLFLAL